MVYYYSNSQELHACEAITHTRKSSKKLAKNMKIGIYLGVKLIFKLFCRQSKEETVFSLVNRFRCWLHHNKMWGRFIREKNDSNMLINARCFPHFHSEISKDGQDYRK